MIVPRTRLGVACSATRIYFLIVTDCPKLHGLHNELPFSNRALNLVMGQHFGESVFSTICRLSAVRPASLIVKV